LTNDTTLVQTVVGSSFSMGLRNLVMGVGAMVMLIWTNPMLMLQVLAVLCLVVLPAVVLGRRVRRLSRANQDRVADASALAGEVLNAIPVVQSYTAEVREADRFEARAWHAMATALRRIRARAVLVGFVIMASSAVLLWGLYMGTLAVREGSISAGVLGQTVFYVILLASAFAVLGETYGDMLRAAGATERLMELLHARSEVVEPLHALTPAGSMGGAELTLSHLRFHYPSRPGTWALDGLSGHVPRGQTVAVVGPSGAGKTTFTILSKARSPWRGCPCPSGPCKPCANAWPWCPKHQWSSPAPFGTTSPMADLKPAKSRCMRPRVPRTPMISSWPCHRAIRPIWAIVGCVSQAGSVNAWRLLAPC
jgi:ATP-binding cassette subfamily B protein